MLYPVYALLFADAGLSTTEISSLFAIWSVTGFLLEVPSGIWADAVSRRLLLTIAPLLGGAGFAAWILAPSYPVFALGFVMWGAQDAIEGGSRSTVTSIASLLTEVLVVAVFVAYAAGSTLAHHATLFATCAARGRRRRCPSPHRWAPVAPIAAARFTFCARPAVSGHPAVRLRFGSGTPAGDARAGVTRTPVSDLFRRNKRAREIERALTALLRPGAWNAARHAPKAQADPAVVGALSTPRKPPDPARARERRR